MSNEIQGWLSNEDYDYIYRRVPMLCVDLLIPQEGGILLSKRAIDPFKGFWHFPGGRVRYKEPVEESVRRIAKAEVGLNVKDIKPIGYVDALEDGEFRHSVSIVFKTILEDGESKLNDEANELKVFHTIPEMMQPYQEYFLKNHLSDAFNSSN